MTEEHGSTTIIKRGSCRGPPEVASAPADDVVHHHQLVSTDGYATAVFSYMAALTGCRRMQPFAKEKVRAIEQ